MAEAVGDGLLADIDQGGKLIVGVNVEDLSAAMQRFHWADYLVFILMLSVCLVIGIYYGFVRSTTGSQDYLVGGRAMKTFPISMSLVASFISGISLLGIPTEIYIYGIQYFYISFGLVLMTIVMHTIFLPVFHDLKITSTYEYLERRFDRKVRVLASVLFTIALCVWLPVVIYVPALAFNQVTGINIHWVTPAVCIICIFYTSVGGIKAVVFTDLIQTAVMFGAMLLVIIKGTIDIGGFRKVLDINLQMERLEAPNLDLNPLSRHTLWSLTIGGFAYYLQTSGVNQNMIQRYLALPTLWKARISLWQCTIGILILTGVCCYTGLLIFATFWKCDPLTTMLAKEKDQLLPILVMEVLGNYPGLPGLFVAGIFSAALSSLSTGLNSMAAVILEDCYKSFFNKKLSEKGTNLLMKSTVILMGAVCVGLVFVVEKLGTVLQLTMSIGPIANGPSLALFSTGILLPWINAQGAFFGSVAGLIVMTWLTVKSQAAIASGDLYFPEKPVTTAGCNYQFTPKLSPALNLHLNPSLNTTDMIHTDELFMLFRLSYLWYTLLGALISILVAVIVTLATKPLDPRDVDPMLLAPFVRKLIPPRIFPNQPKLSEVIYAYKTDINNVNEDKVPSIHEEAAKG